MVTKGYGLTVQDIDESCPADLEPYAEVYKLEEKKADERMWTMGIYVMSAVQTAIEKNLAGRKAKSEYMKEPISYMQERNRTDLTEEEKQREVDLFFAQNKAMRMNWKRNHKKSSEE